MARLLRAAVFALLGLSAVTALLVRPSPSSRGLSCAIADSTKFRTQSLQSDANAIVALRTTQGDDDNNDSVNDNDNEDSSEPSLLDKLNKFLDTPILDANNRSDQGAVSEVLKEFVRDEPEIAQVTFSVAVVAILVLVTKFVTSL